ncbi:hypothetical protein Acr_10g0001970 [Actinidia rufa]|uniref:Uncharacterized protein n=1 Tax=Actinidia rufa TaxID=165716 RepID=A0A7J0F7Y1_9ERIC|nr:hypothetical protein Acr_10g0001970 [Actinidia rufa]
MVLDKPDSMDPDGTSAPGVPGGQLQHPTVGQHGKWLSLVGVPTREVQLCFGGHYRPDPDH